MSEQPLRSEEAKPLEISPEEWNDLVMTVRASTSIAPTYLSGTAGYPEEVAETLFLELQERGIVAKDVHKSGLFEVLPEPEITERRRSRAAGIGKSALQPFKSAVDLKIYDTTDAVHAVTRGRLGKRKERKRADEERRTDTARRLGAAQTATHITVKAGVDPLPREQTVIERRLQAQADFLESRRQRQRKDGKTPDTAEPADFGIASDKERLVLLEQERRNNLIALDERVEQTIRLQAREECERQGVDRLAKDEFSALANEIRSRIYQEAYGDISDDQINALRQQLRRFQENSD